MGKTGASAGVPLVHGVPMKTGAWSPDEDDKLAKYQKQFGNKWSVVAQYIPGRTGQQCAQRWRHKVNPNIKKDKWTAEEDAQLTDLVSQYGNRWAEIARHMDGRTDQQCMGRWTRHLDPSISREVWTAEEDALLVALYNECGTQWSRISKQVSGRTAQQCRARFFQLKPADAAAAAAAAPPSATTPVAGGAGGARAKSGLGTSSSGRGRKGRAASPDEGDELEYDAEFESLGNYKPRSSRRQIQRRARGSDEEEPTPKRKRAEGEEGKEGKERRHPPSEATPRPPAGAGKAGALGQRGTPEPRRGRADGGAGPLRALSPNRVGAAPKSNTSAVRAALSGALGPPMVSPSLASALASALGGGRGVGGMGEDAGPTIESILTSPLKAGSAPPLFTPSVLGPLGTHTNENTPSKFLNPSGLSPLRTHGGAEVGAMNAQGAAGAATPTVRTRSHRTAGPSAPSSLRLGTRGLRSALGQGLDSAPDSAQRGEGLGGDRLGVGEGALPWRLSPTVGFSSPPLGGAGGGDGGGELVGMGMGALGLGLGMGMGIEGLSAGMTPICGAMPSPGFLGLETPDLFQARSARRRPSDPAARGGAGPPGEGSTPLRVRGGAGEGLATGGRGAAGRRGSAVRTPVDEGAAGARSPGAGLGTGQTGVTLEHLPGVRGRSSMGTIQKPKTPSERVPAPSVIRKRARGLGYDAAEPFSPFCDPLGDAPLSVTQRTQPNKASPLADAPGTAKATPKTRLLQALERC